jgi:hypothetical protein
VTEASRAVTIAETSGGDHEPMLATEELAACEEAAGDTPLYLSKQQGGNAVGTASLGVRPAEAPSQP